MNAKSNKIAPKRLLSMLLVLITIFSFLPTGIFDIQKAGATVTVAGGAGFTASFQAALDGSDTDIVLPAGTQTLTAMLTITNPNKTFTIRSDRKSTRLNSSH